MTERPEQRIDGDNPIVARYRALAAEIRSSISDVPPMWHAARPTARDAYQAKVDRWHELMSELYDPLYAARAAVIRGNESKREMLVSFLEADVYCHRSGYFKVDAIRALTRQDLIGLERQRLSRVLLAVVAGPDRREFRGYVRLARALDDPDLRSQLESLARSPEPRTARHARWILEGIGARSTAPNSWDDGLISAIFRLLRQPAAVMFASDLGPLLEDGAAALDEPYRSAFETLAADLRSSPDGRISSEDLAAVRERFEAAMRSRSTPNSGGPVT